jgi:serine/threonine protein kinase
VLRLCLEVNPKRRINMEDLADHPWITRNIFQSQVEKAEEPRKMEPIK